MEGLIGRELWVGYDVREFAYARHLADVFKAFDSQSGAGGDGGGSDGGGGDGGGGGG